MCTRLLSQPHKNVSTSITHMTVSKAATTSMYPWINKLPMFPCFQTKQEGRKSPPKVYNVTDDKREWTQWVLHALSPAFRHASTHTSMQVTLGNASALTSRPWDKCNQNLNLLSAKLFPVKFWLPLHQAPMLLLLQGLVKKEKGKSICFWLWCAKKKNK